MLYSRSSREYKKSMVILTCDSEHQKTWRLLKGWWLSSTSGDFDSVNGAWESAFSTSFPGMAAADSAGMQVTFCKTPS